MTSTPTTDAGLATPTERPLLELIDVHAAYGRIEVLRGVSFRVPRGAVVALLGPNGAGKSTTLAVISGQMTPTSGHVHIDGAHANGAKVHHLVGIGMCTVPEGRSIFPNLTVEENLRLSGFTGQATDEEIFEVAYAQFPRLGERRKQAAGTMSGGEQQMLAMARSLAVNPGLLLLDELSMGLAPLIVADLYDVVRGIAETGVTVLVVEQFARTALAVADYGVVMVNGRVTGVGEPQDIEAEVSEAYLGGE